MQSLTNLGKSGGQISASASCSLGNTPDKPSTRSGAIDRQPAPDPDVHEPAGEEVGAPGELDQPLGLLTGQRAGHDRRGPDRRHAQPIELGERRARPDDAPPARRKAYSIGTASSLAAHPGSPLDMSETDPQQDDATDLGYRDEAEAEAYEKEEDDKPEDGDPRKASDDA